MKQSRSEECKLGYDAAQWIWNLLWTPDQSESSFAKLNILDVIQISSDQSVNGWIFTSSNGLIKSKSKSRWNEVCINDRLNNTNTNSKASESIKFNAHLITKDNRKWSCVYGDSISGAINERICCTVVSFAHLSDCDFTFAEQTYELRTDQSLPKIKTYNLCGSMAKGKLLSSTSSHVESPLPSEKILSFNKFSNECFKNFTLNLVRIIESKCKCKIIKMGIVGLMSSVKDNNIASLQTNDKVIWLHHVNEIVFSSSLNSECSEIEDRSNTGTPRMSEKAATSISMSEKRSTMCSAISNSSSNFMRYSRCMGDFCTFQEVEESRHMYEAATVGDGDGEGDIKTEVFEAKKRHRPISSDEKMPFNTRDRTSTSSQADGNEKDDVDIANISDDGGEAEADDYVLDGLLPTLKCTAKKVPYKSVVLSRQEMLQVESLGNCTVYQRSSCPWPESLRHWWWRVGRSVAFRKGSVTVPQSSSYQIGVSMLTSANLNSLEKLARKDELESDPLLPPHPVLLNTEQSSSRSEGGRVESEEGANGSGMKRVGGQMSWYYSEARVCENCYSVYRDLDRRRGHKQKLQIQELKRVKEKVEETNAKELDKRIFEQRKFVSRLASLQTKSKSNKYSSELESPDAGNMSMSMMQASYISSISHLTDDFNHMLQPMSRPSQLAGSSSSASKLENLYPPLPWQLTNKEQREKYEASGSAFIRNIKNKADEIAASLYAQKLLSDPIYRVKDRDKDRGYLKEERDDYPKRHEDDWKKLTGQNESSSRRIIDPNKVKPIDPMAAVFIRKAKKKTFNPERLLHPWQREMEKLRREQTTNNNGNGNGVIADTGNGNDAWNSGNEDGHDVDMEEDFRFGQSHSPQKKFNKPLVLGVGIGKLQRSQSLPPLSEDNMMAASFDTTGSLAYSQSSSNSVGLGNELGPQSPQSIKLKPSSLESLNKFANLTKTNISISSPTRNNNKVSFATIVSNRDYESDSISLSTLKSPQHLSPTKKVIGTNGGGNIKNPLFAANSGGGSTQEKIEGDQDGDDDDDDDAIGWSPFTINLD